MIEVWDNRKSGGILNWGSYKFKGVAAYFDLNKLGDKAGPITVGIYRERITPLYIFVIAPITRSQNANVLSKLKYCTLTAQASYIAQLHIALHHNSYLSCFTSVLLFVSMVCLFFSFKNND